MKYKLKSLIKNLILSVSVVLIGCGNPLSSENDVFIDWDMRLPIDENGYYHLTLDTEKWQTIHRVSGSVTDGIDVVDLYKGNWKSNLYWYLGDTLGYVVKRDLTDDLEYVSYDTVYVTGFNGMEVPTSNMASYSNSDGEINNMIAPIKTMKGDTLRLTAYYESGFKTFGIVLE